MGQAYTQSILHILINMYPTSVILYKLCNGLDLSNSTFSVNKTCVCLQCGPLAVLSGLISPLSRVTFHPIFPTILRANSPAHPITIGLGARPILIGMDYFNHMTGMNSPRFTCLSKTILRTSGPGPKLGNIRIEFNPPGGLARHHHG